MAVASPVVITVLHFLRFALVGRECAHDALQTTQNNTKQHKKAPLVKDERRRNAKPWYHLRFALTSR
jgi:hypothetical protein